MAKRHKRTTERSERICQFIECLIVPSGKGAGERFKLRDWQKKFISDVYDPVTPEGRRVVRRATLSIGRKNGKTALIAALVLAHLVGPEAIKNGEIYSAANDREQAAQVFKFCRQIVDADPELAGLVTVVPSTKTLVCYGNGSVYRAISSDAGNKHGLNPSVVIYDELSQSKNRELYDALDTAMGAREEPLFVVISTQSNDPQHILSQLIDDGLKGSDPTTVTHLYAVPDEVENIFDSNVWALANPALGDFRSFEDMQAQAERAKRMPSFEAPFRNLYLNQRIDAQSPLIARTEWKACQVERGLEPGEAIYLGLDLSSTTDLTALVAVSAENGDRVKAWFWKPKAAIRDHETRDRAPYAVWAQQGWLATPEGRAIDYSAVAQTIAEVAADYQVKGIAYDRWRIENLMREFDGIGLASWIDGKDAQPNGVRLVPWGQGFKDMAPAIDALEVSIIERRFAHDGNPVLAFCFANAVAVTDPSGNRKLDKSKTRFRIDGAVATAMAIGLKGRDTQGGGEIYSPWDDPEFSLVTQ